MQKMTMEERFAIEREAIRAINERCLNPETDEPYLYIGTVRKAAKLYLRLLSSYYLASQADVVVDEDTGKWRRMNLIRSNSSWLGWESERDCNEGERRLRGLLVDKSQNEILLALNQFRGNAKVLHRTTYFRLATLLKAAGLWRVESVTQQPVIMTSPADCVASPNFVAKAYQDWLTTKQRVSALAAKKKAAEDEARAEAKAEKAARAAEQLRKLRALAATPPPPRPKPKPQPELDEFETWSMNKEIYEPDDQWF